VAGLRLKVSADLTSTEVESSTTSILAEVEDFHHIQITEVSGAAAALQCEEMRISTEKGNLTKFTLNL
jgi:hypothetical protein